MKKGLFITLEGIDGSGKSTLSKGLAEQLKSLGYETLMTRAPGGTPTGAQIRELILHGKLHDIKAELFLFLADRAEHVASVIKPAIDAGKIVICDRFSDSTVAYQVERGLDRSKVEQLCQYATSGLEPDLTLLVDLDPEMAYERIHKSRHKDRIENEGLYLMTKIRQSYLDLAKSHKRIVIIDGKLSVNELLDTSLDHVTRFISKRS
jgi:dTMP kinase